MFQRVYYNLEKYENGQWQDYLGSYDLADFNAWREECQAEDPGEYRTSEQVEQYAVLIKDIMVVRISERPIDQEVVILSARSFMDYISKLESFSVSYLTVNAHGVVAPDAETAYLLTLEEDPMADGLERKWDFLNLCATETDADALIAKLKRNEEEIWMDSDDSEYEDTKKRCLERRYYKRAIKVIQ
jgi:hypothetical protein